MKRTWAAVIASVVLVSHPVTAALAGEGSVSAAASQKVVRGLTNTGLGVIVEVPKTVYYDTLEDGPLYGLTIGVLEGLSWGMARTLAGIYEVVTFPFPIPNGYRPIYRPNYPYEPGRIDVAD